MDSAMKAGEEGAGSDDAVSGADDETEESKDDAEEGSEEGGEEGGDGASGGEGGNLGQNFVMPLEVFWSNNNDRPL